MKKFMRIALVFALAGAALMYTGCTKDYSGDISDLNKKVSEQASALSALQTQVAAAQSSASEALSSAQNALKEAQAAAKAAEAANNDAEVAALTTKIATIEGNIADLQAKVEALNGLEAKLNEVADQLKKDVDAKVDAALEEIQKELEKAIAQVEGNFSVDGIGHQTAIYASAKWNPGNKANEKKLLAKLTEVFPELADLKKGDKVETFGHINFIVNPSSVVLDDTYKFALVGVDGKDRKVVLGNPTPGININGIEAETKAGLTVWNVEVQSPAYDGKGAALKEEKDLALVVENAAGVYAQTLFAYTVKADDSTTALQLDSLKGKSFAFDDTKSENSFDAFEKLFQKKAGAIYDNYFIIEADAADVEEFGIKFDGSKITLTEAPTEDTVIPFTITAVGVDGSVSQAKNVDFKVTYTKSIAPNAELAAQDVTLGYNKTYKTYNVPVTYNVADFGFSALEWKTVYEALTLTGDDVPTIKITDSKNKEYPDFVATGLSFVKADGQPAGGYSDAVAFRFNVNSAKAIPGTYNVAITSAKGTFAGKGELTIANPETCPVKLIEALCKDGVLQIVGDIATEGEGEAAKTYVKYNLKNALVYNSDEAKIVAKSFVDLDQTSSDEDNWVKDSVNFSIPTAKPWDNLLYKTRNFSVDFAWFKNEKTTTSKGNIGTFEFKAQAVSPIYDAEGKAVVTENQTIYIGGDNKTEFTSFEVNKIVKSAKYVAGDDVNKAYNVFQVWKTVAEVPARYKHTFVADGTKNYSEIDAEQQPQHGWGVGYDSKIDNGALVLDNSGEFITISKDDANILRGFGLNDQEILNVREADTPLYLTKPMLEFAYNEGTTKDEHGWHAFYDIYGDKIGGTITSNDDTSPFTCSFFTQKFKDTVGPTHEAYNKSTEEIIAHYKQWDKSGFEDEDGWTANFKKSINTLAEGIEANKVAAYNSVKANFDTATTEKYNEKEDATYAKDTGKARSAAIKSVKVAFDNPDYADEFIANVQAITDPYEGNEASAHSATISVDSHAEFKAGLTSVTLPAYIEIADKWGMTMKIPFTVTVKTATK